jgi:hypothetical protein
VLDAERDGGGPLTVQINQKHIASPIGETGCDVDGGRRLPNASFVIDDGKGAKHSRSISGDEGNTFLEKNPDVLLQPFWVKSSKAKRVPSRN